MDRYSSAGAAEDHRSAAPDRERYTTSSTATRTAIARRRRRKILASVIRWRLCYRFGYSARDIGHAAASISSSSTKPTTCATARARATGWWQLRQPGAGALLPSQFGSAPEVDALNPGHRQIIEATLICLEAIGRTKPHSVVAMEYEAK
jgi:hypothetical protein